MSGWHLPYRLVTPERPNLDSYQLWNLKRYFEKSENISMALCMDRFEIIRPNNNLD